MPIEKARTTSVRRIYKPGEEESDGTHVDIKVIDSITFVDPTNGYQETVITYHNDPEASREVEIKEVGEDKLKVERPTSLNKMDETAGFQEIISSYTNVPSVVHLETRKVKVYSYDAKTKTKDTDVWVEIERVDKISFVDEKDGFQEIVYELVNPDKEDPEADYTNLGTPLWKNTNNINPPYRLDPYQHIVDASFGGSTLFVMYGTNKVAIVSIGATSKTGTNQLKLSKKRTLVQSSWRGDYMASWFPTNTPKFFLKAGQFKLKKDFHVASCSIKVSPTGVISLPATLEQRPVYNIADTLMKYAECSTPSFDQMGYDMEGFGPSNDPMMNGSDYTVFNEYGDKFSWTKAGGIKKDSSGVVDYYAMWIGYLNTHSAIDSTGGRWSVVEVFGNGMYANSGVTSPWTTAQETTWEESPGYGNDIFWGWRFGPGDADVSYAGIEWPPIGTGAHSGSFSITTKMLVYAKSAGLDVIDAHTISVDCAWSMDEFYDETWSIVYNGSPARTGASHLLSFDSNAAHMPFPYATEPTFAGMYYRTDRYLAFNSEWVEIYQTPYETWTTETLHTGDVHDYNIYFQPWLQISNGTHMLQGYLKNGKKRIFLNEKDVGSTLAGVIGCDIEDIVTILMDVKMSDFDKLK